MLSIGIDVGKKYLDVAIYGGEHWRLPNTPEGVAALQAQLDQRSPACIAVEPSGGYERLALDVLSAAGLPVALVNPRKVRGFARAVGLQVKTDKVDSYLLARFAAVVKPPVRTVPDASARELVALVSRRRQLIAMRRAEMNRREGAESLALESLDRHIAWLSAEVVAADLAIVRAVKASPAWSERAALLRSVPGIGATLVPTLLAEFPELGFIDRHEAASLVGLAPYNRDSGNHLGRRKIVGGRADLRTALYMPAITATRCNPAISAMYKRLIASGKPHKVAITACMRRLVVIANAIIANGTPWEDRNLTTERTFQRDRGRGGDSAPLVLAASAAP